MKVALSPLEFARRARRLYAKNEAVVDGDLRFTYEQFLNRCDQWSNALQKMELRRGIRSRISPLTPTRILKAITLFLKLELSWCQSITDFLPMNSNI